MYEDQSYVVRGSVVCVKEEKSVREERGIYIYIQLNQGIVTAYSYLFVSIAILCLAVEPSMLIYSGVRWIEKLVVHSSIERLKR